MADSTLTLNTDILIKPGQVIGREKIRQLITRELKNVQDSIRGTNIDVRPTVTLDPAALKDLEGTIGRYQKAISDQLTSGFGAGKGEPLSKAQVQELQLLRKQFTGLERALTTRVRGEGALPFLDDKDKSFQRTLQLFTEGKYVEPGTGVVKRATPGLRNVQALTGPDELPELPKIPERDLQNIARYRSYLGEIRKQLEGYQSSLRSITGSKEKAALIDPLLGKDLAEIKRQEKSLDSLLDPDAAVRRERQVNRAIEQERKRALRIKRQEELAENRRLKKLATDRAKLRSEATQRVERANQKKELARARRVDTRLREARRTGDFTGIDRADLIRSQRAFAKEAKLAATSIDDLNKKGKSGTREFQKGMARNSRALDVFKRKANEAGDALKRLDTSGGKPRLRTGTRERLEAARIAKNARELTAIETGERILSGVGGEAGIFSVPRRYREDVKAALLARRQLLEADRAKLDPKASNYTQEFNRFTSALGDNGRAIERLKGRMSEFGSITNQTASLFRQFFRYALGYGALYQALQAIRALTVGITDLQEALKSIQAVAGATVSEMRIVEDGIKRVALTTQFNAREIAQAAQILSQAGVVPTDLPAAIEATARFASATGSALEVSADLVTSFRNVFTDLDDSGIANILTRAINISKLTAEDLKTVVSLSSQIADSYNLTSEQYLAAVTTLRNAGIKPSTVATGLRQGLIELFSPDSKTVKAIKTRYKQLGEELSTDEIRDQFFGFAVSDSPLVNVLRELQRLGFTGEGKKVFQRAYDIRAENAISALIKNIEELESASARLTFGEAAALAAETQMEALSHSVRNLGAAISVFSYNLAKDALGPLEDFTDGLTSSVERMDQLQTRMKRFTGAGFGQALGTGLVTGAVGAAVSRGSLPYRIASFFGAGAAGTAASVTSKTRQADEAEGQFESTFDRILAQFGDAMLVGAAAMSPAIIRWFKNWAANSFTIPGRIQGDLFENTARRQVSSYAFKILDTVKQFFRDLSLTVSTAFKLSPLAAFFKPFTKLIVGIGRLLRGSPIISGLLAFYGLLQVLNKFFDPDEITKAERQYEALLDERQQAEERYRKALEAGGEFRLSDTETGYKARSGTAASTLEDIQSDFGLLQSDISKYFGVQGDEVGGLTSFLATLSQKAAESGSALREKLKREFAKGKEYEKALLESDEKVLSDFGARASAVVQRAEGVREAMRQYIGLLNDADRQLNAGEKAFLEAVDIVVSGNQEYLRVVSGLSTGLGPIEEATKVLEIQGKIYEKTTEISGAAEQTRREAEAAQKSTEEIAAQVLRRISEEGLDGFDVQKALLDLTGPLNELDEETIKRLKRASEAVQTVLDKVKEDAASFDEAYAQYKQARSGLADLQEQKGSDRRQRRLLQRQTSQAQTQVDELSGKALDFPGRKEASIRAQETEKAAAAAQAFIQGNLNVSREAAEGERDYYVQQIENIRSLNQSSERINTALKSIFPSDTPEGKFARDVVLNAELTPESIVKIAEDSNRVYAEGGSLDDFFKNVNRYQQLAVERGEDVEPFLADRDLTRRTAATERDIKIAEKSRSYRLLTTDNEENLYRQLQTLRNQAIEREIAYINTQIPRAETDAAKQRLLEKRDGLENKLIDLEFEAQTNIQTRAIEEAEKVARDLRATNDLKIRGLEKRVAIEIDSGNLERAAELDEEVIRLKEEIISANVSRLQKENRSQEEIDRFVRNAQTDLVPVLRKPSTARTIRTATFRNLDRDTPREPRLGATRFEEGYRRARGEIASPTQVADALSARATGAAEKIEDLQKAVDKLRQTPFTDPESNEALNDNIETIQLLKEELGALQSQFVLEGGEGFGKQGLAQLQVGFDPQQIANRIATLNGAIRNLGKTIQDDIVGGLDNAADSFSNALVRGEDFADSTRQALSDMLYAIAADIVKSGVLSLIGGLIGGVFGGPGGAAVGSQAGAAVANSRDGGRVEDLKFEKRAAGGVISGPGTGTSDSIAGVVTDSKGRATKGVYVSDGEGILKEKTTSGLGRKAFYKLNDMKGQALAQVRAVIENIKTYRDGGIPSEAASGARAAALAAAKPLTLATGGLVKSFSQTVNRYSNGGVVAGSTRLLTASMPKPLAMATGGIVGDMSSRRASMSYPEKDDSASGHTYRAEVMVGAQEGSGVDADTLRRVDEGITVRVQEYIQEQMRPGGLLQNSRARGGRG